MSTGDCGVEHTARVYQAQGMVAAQAHCTLEAALALMWNTAAASDVTLEQLADEVVNGNVSFE